ncbi:MAG: Coenzyme F420 hydrogenase/dehydrogenase, beta subunit C-terminal domain [Promethearchaeota archaeon]
MTESTSKNENEDLVKVFEDLLNEIINTSKCCACGACVAYCESQSFDVIEMKGYIPQFKSDATIDNCTKCGLCYYICPQTDTLLDKLNEFHHIIDENGYIREVLAAKTTNNNIAKVGQDGGIVTTILTYLFDTNKIDVAIVSERDENWHPIPKLVFNRKDLLKTSGTRYSISSQILPLKDIYTAPIKILDEKGILDVEEFKIAFVGTPCQCRAIAKMKFLHIKPAHMIKYIISLFCYENFDYEKLYHLIEQETKVKRENIQKTWIKKNFFIRDKAGKEFEIGIKTLDSAVREHCHMCDEFTGRFSDISVGAQGAPLGYSFIIIRTENGQKIVYSLRSLGLIEQYMIPLEQKAEWQTKKLNWLKKLLSFKIK